MPRQVTQIRIFVASPGDVSAERDTLAEVVEDLQHGIGQEKDLALELVRWESHAYPAMGEPQGVINRQLEPYDIFVGIFCHRFGTPTSTAGSGTEEEFRRAYASWERTGSPPILFYFCERPLTAKARADLEQMGRVLDFRKSLRGSGLYWTYTTVEDFKRKVRRHLEKTLRELLSAGSHRAVQSEYPTAGTETGKRRSRPGNPVSQQTASPRRFEHIPVPKIKREVSDLDKRTFVRETFALVRDYFEAAGDALQQEHPQTRTLVEPPDSQSFTCEVFVGGTSRNRCKIWIGGSFGENSIAYVEGSSAFGSFSGNTMNDYVTLETDGGELYFRASGMGFSSSAQASTRLDPEGVAAYFWERFVRPLSY